MTEPLDAFLEKETAISNIILGHINTGREQLGLPAPTPLTSFAVAARDTVQWFAGEEYFEDKIEDYLKERCAHHLGKAHSSWFLQLAYGRHTWPVGAEPSAVAKEMIERIGLSGIVVAPRLDYLALGSCHAVLDHSGNAVQVSGSQPDKFGYAVVIAYATDGSSMIVERINNQREAVDAAPLQISASLNAMVHKYVKSNTQTVTEKEDVLQQDIWDFGYLTEGWQGRFGYGGAYSRIPATQQMPLTQPQLADALTSELLVRFGHMLLRPDWQDIGIATAIGSSQQPNRVDAIAEFVLGWRIPFGSERPAHSPSPIPFQGDPSSLPKEHQAETRRKRSRWPFGSRT